MKAISSGNIRENYEVSNDTLVIVTTDRISVFDSVLPTLIPHKGQVLNRLSCFWFLLTEHLVPNHMITIDNNKMPSEFQSEELLDRCMLVQKVKMLPVEAVVRGYIYGSAWTSYLKDGSICGIKLPKGMKESQRLREVIFTPTAKETNGHDIPIDYPELERLIGKDLAYQLQIKSIRLYKTCAEYAYSKGIIIADTKFEFGVDSNGNLVLADEVLTPDSSRFWLASDYSPGHPQSSFDKQYLRDYLKSVGWHGQENISPPELPKIVVETTISKYLKAYEMLTGTTF